MLEVDDTTTNDLKILVANQKFKALPAVGVGVLVGLLLAGESLGLRL